MERRGKGGEQYIDRRRRAVQWPDVSRQYQPPSRSRMKYGASAPAVDGLPLNWAILRFLVKGIGWRDCTDFSNAGLFTIRNGARRGKRARAWRIENSPARGRDTRTLFEGGRGKAFWCRGGGKRRRLPLCQATIRPSNNLTATVT
jgi:hypothetical protein